MNKIKSIFSNFDKQKVTFFGGVLIIIIILIIIVSTVAKNMGNKISYERLENKLISAAESYAKDNPNVLPTESVSVTNISDTTLIENKYLKSLKKYVKDSSCTANVSIYYKKGKYDYVPVLTCNSYKTERLVDKLKINNNLSSFGEGMYEMNNELVYRGENPNNYIEFANELWRILKVNSNGQIVLIKDEFDAKYYGHWDNRYNSDIESQKGINNFALSRALEYIKDFYEELYLEYEDYLEPFDLCVGKRSEYDFLNDGSVECREKLTDQYIGLIPVYDYMNASLDSSCTTVDSRECQNYNYLAGGDKWWTLTGGAESTHEVYYVNASGTIILEDAIMSANYRYTLALNSNILYKSGSGTYSDPYKIR